jgi:hypothetical protein
MVCFVCIGGCCQGIAQGHLENDNGARLNPCIRMVGKNTQQKKEQAKAEAVVRFYFFSIRRPTPMATSTVPVMSTAEP